MPYLTLLSPEFMFQQKWLSQRIQSVEEIRALANELHGHQRNVNIARVTGTSVGESGVNF